MNKSYRDNGAIGALLDEYEKAVNELVELIRPITSAKMAIIADHQTKDLDCRSIQSILTHVVSAGYNYVVAIRKWKGEELKYYPKDILNESADYIQALLKMFAFNEQLFNDYPKLILETYDPNGKILVSWGQIYDVEQLLEHAIVHVLRHRRQIERFLLKIENK